MHTNTHPLAVSNSRNVRIRSQQTTIALTRIASKLLPLALASAAHAQSLGPPPCLPNSNGDGHPLFGNPMRRTLPEPTEQGEPNALFNAPATAVAFGDLDGDGDPDAVVTHSSSKVAAPFSVLLNDGDGVFELHGLYEAGFDANFVTLADLDGDGDVDAAISCGYNDSRIFIFVNDGTATFSQARAIPVGGIPTCVRALDVDGDRHNDLVTLNDNEKTDHMTLLRNDGHGGFAAGTTFACGNFNGWPATTDEPGPHFDSADFDGDGDLDLVIPNEKLILILLNDGAGSFSPAPVSPKTNEYHLFVATGDANNDGLPDIFTNSDYPLDDPGVSVFFNTSTPQQLNFSGPAHFPAAPGAPYIGPGVLGVGDIDGDGFADAVTSGVTEFYEGAFVFRNGGKWPLLLNNPWADYGAEFIPIAAGTWFATLADVNGDGRPDLCTLDPDYRSTLRVLLNDGLGGFHHEHRFPPAVDYSAAFHNWNWFDVADIDADGDVDAVVAQSHSDSKVRMNVLFNNGKGDLNRIEPYSDSAAPQTYGTTITLTDLTGDGVADAILTDSGFERSGAVWTMINDGRGGFTRGAKHPLDGLIPGQMAAGDLDQDGDQDVVVWTIETFNPDPNALHERRVLVFLNDGAGRLSLGAQVSWMRGPWSGVGGIALGDLNADGALDLAVSGNFQYQQSAQVAVYLNDGRGNLLYEWDAETLPSARALCLGDVENDGDLDIFVSAYPYPKLQNVYCRVWRNDGGTFGAPFDLYDFQRNGVYAMVLGDVNADGQVDVVAGGAVGHISANLDPFHYGVPVHHSVESWPSCVKLADFDGDGRLDVAATLEYWGQLAILFNRACPPPPPAR